MSLSPKWRFTESLIGDAPEFKGVYVLWANDVPLAAGHALGAPDTIRSRLVAHRSHTGTPGMERVTHYSWEICSDPVRREREVTRALGLSDGQGAAHASRASAGHPVPSFPTIQEPLPKSDG
jgi:hypothetical protein